MDARKLNSPRWCTPTFANRTISRQTITMGTGTKIGAHYILTKSWRRTGSTRLEQMDHVQITASANLNRIFVGVWITHIAELCSKSAIKSQKMLSSNDVLELNNATTAKKIITSTRCLYFFQTRQIIDLSQRNLKILKIKTAKRERNLCFFFSTILIPLCIHQYLCSAAHHHLGCILQHIRSEMSL